MSEAENNQVVVHWLKQKTAAEHRLKEIDRSLQAIGERLIQLGRALQDKRLEAQELRPLLQFGPESGVTVEGLVKLLEDRERCVIVKEDCTRQLKNSGVDM